MKKTIQLTLTTFMLLSLGTAATAASFDCRKASNGIEKTICDDPELNRLDSEMGRLYHKAKHLPGVKEEQKNWVHRRNKMCGSSDGCLLGETKDRIAELKKTLGTQGKSHKSHTKSTHKGSVYFPEHGIVCDKKSGFCADKEGISLGFTQEYLGEEKAIKFDKLIEKHHMDTSSYTLSNGIYCDSHTKKCYNNKWKEKVNHNYTNKLFR
jgi:uncharacterized protein